MKWVRRKSYKFTSFANRFDCLTTRAMRKMKNLKRFISTLFMLERVIKNRSLIIKMCVAFSREYFLLQYRKQQMIRRYDP